MAWQATAIRLVFFGPMPGIENAGQLFHHLTGAFPSSLAQQSPMPGHTTAAGIVADHPLGIIVQPGRLELNCSNEQEFNMPAIGDVRGTVDRLAGYITKLSDGRLIQRIGVIVEVEEEASTDTEARSLMQRNLPSYPFPPGAREVMVQMNVQTLSTILPGMEINRICKWGAITKQFMQFAIGQQVGSPTIVNVGHASTLGLDVNTPAGRTTPFLPETVAPLTVELANHALAILDNGYGQLL